MKAVNILEKILLPVNHDWVIDKVSVKQDTQEIYVDLKYISDIISVSEFQYPIYDLRPVRTWRHLDLWEYKTFLRLKKQRFKCKNCNPSGQREAEKAKGKCECSNWFQLA